MDTQKYSVNQHLIETLLAWVKSGEIAIPEIQRPFVWDASKVRDLMDSLYQGYPIGYIITWLNPNVRLKDGTTATGKKVLIDGQQRVTALTAAILGQYVVTKDYKRVRIKIAFNPITEKFEVQTPIILRDKTWIPDISEILDGQSNSFSYINTYLAENPSMDKDHAVKSISKLFDLTKKQVGLIDLAADLDIETVTEIFIRINAQGVVLSQADFVMSKIAANEQYGGQDIRKAIDYFSHLAIAPEFFQYIADNDKDFAKTDFFQKMTWLKNENEDLYDPKYTDVLRVAFSTQFNRGKLSDLVSLLSGRNFETRTFEADIAEASFNKLSDGIHQVINETNFKRFVMIIKSAGFIHTKMVRSQNVINFAYILYLRLRAKGENQGNIESYVRRWFVFSVLTGRYSGSPESMFDLDLRQMEITPFAEYLAQKEEANLSEAFWSASLVQSLNSSVSSSPYFNAYLASQVKANDKGFLSKEITVSDLITYRGDIHHIFPKNYLKKSGLPRGKYNQIANYVYMKQEVNIQVGDKAPEIYLGDMLKQCQDQGLKYGGIDRLEELHQNLENNCIPESVFTMNIEDYDEFLLARRKLMAKKMKDYYYSL